MDVRGSGSKNDEAYDVAAKIACELQNVPGVVDSHVFQVPDAPALTVEVDRPLATEVGATQQGTANNVLVATNSSAQTAPNFWVDPRNGVSYPLVVQLPTYRIESAADLWTMPVTAGAGRDERQLLMNISTFGRTKVPLITSQLNIRPVFDVHADIQGRDLYSSPPPIDTAFAAIRP